MPQIGWFEILIIVAISIIVIGPKDFPFMLKKMGSWIGSVKRYVRRVQQEISVLDTENFETKIEDTNKAEKREINDQGKK